MKSPAVSAHGRLAAAAAAIFVVVLLVVSLSSRNSALDAAVESSRLMFAVVPDQQLQPPSYEPPLCTTRKALHPGSYGLSAHRNLIKFRSGLMKSVVRAWHQGRVSDQALKYQRFDHFPVSISCPPDQALVHYGGWDGKGDGNKAFCDLSQLQSPCIIYSVGSNGDYSFEQSVLQHTHCDVYTFDCTYAGSSVDGFRHQYHELCVGHSPEGDPRFKTWRQLLKHLGHSRIDVLKVDIEGFEYELFAELAEEDDAILPLQIGVEFHFQIAPDWDAPHNLTTPWTEGLSFPTAAWTTSDMALTFLHLANLGYAPLYREDNLWEDAGCCSEFSFLKVEQAVQPLPHCAS